ncbi:hypothetical protein FIBSPDRAFT_968076 [Athelia psychrophila]|uniref:Uncharacterized protein n=1 Tax=Athelia psychrophila TaxID=1759441 RepID=A0A167V0Z9_9AGAM|nr:hypothetical protein FIBSPDRAFT_968076 [Fibularhizoctonia sp. CBS 109695]
MFTVRQAPLNLPVVDILYDDTPLAHTSPPRHPCVVATLVLSGRIKGTAADAVLLSSAFLTTLKAVTIEMEQLLLRTLLRPRKKGGENTEKRKRGEAQWAANLKRQSRALEKPVQEYKIKYKHTPPKEFDY